jgi:DnaK suppressor protein
MRQSGRVLLQFPYCFHAGQSTVAGLNRPVLLSSRGFFMTDADKTGIRSKIVSEIQRLELDAERLGALTDPAALEGLDEVARMDAIVSKSMHDATLAAARQRIGKLEYALKRIAGDPEFGCCIECGDTIPLPRLMSMPEALRCVDCAE